MIAHKQNDILRILTVFSVVLLPLTLISGIYGMNFDRIPFRHDAHGFYDHRPGDARDRRVHAALLPPQGWI